MSASYTIGDLAREFGCTTRAIRFYEDQGLLSPGREGLSRVYGSKERVRLKLILRGKRLGLTLAEAGEILDMYDAPEGEVGQLRYFVQRIRERRKDLVSQREDIDNALSELNDLEQRCLRSLEGAEGLRQAS